ncbi:Clathrin interactor EPSIN 2 [Vitis vinifera]|uniref:Clathrin interactor EPSIN 2 n=1 Tax=Vitis vinifera TaxID=29760 RepID=A0A438G5K9_VITVI|nr:Clathrin interactor EPSIN 2 [Vitis vinifera]
MEESHRWKIWGGRRVGILVKRRAKFWKDKWCGDKPSNASFPSLYVLTISKEAWVVNLSDQTSEGGHLNPLFYRHLNDWELDEVGHFFSRLQGKTVIREGVDGVVCMDSRNGTFSIKALYFRLARKSVDFRSASEDMAIVVRETILGWDKEHFDQRPKNIFLAVPATSIGPEMDLLGSLSESFSSNSLALVPSGPATTTSEAAVLGNAGSAPASAAMPSGSAVMSQSFEDPFGDSPFRALPSAESVPAQPQDSASTTSFQTMNQTSGPPFPVTQGVDTGSNFDFGDTFPGITYTPSGVSTAQPPSASPQFSPQEQWIPQQNNDILADILPPSGSSAPAILQAAFPAPTGQSVLPNPNVVGGFLAQSGSADHAASQFSPQIPTGPAAQYNNGNFLSQLGSAAPVLSQAPLQGPVPSQSPFQAPVPSQSPFQAPVSSVSFSSPSTFTGSFSSSRTFTVSFSTLPCFYESKLWPTKPNGVSIPRPLLHKESSFEFVLTST